ncbi:MAG: hypothetical protein MJA84_10825, partial [Firmicutes bacterium]|nr:hypothetical protein [Bacillota bacterium]
KLHTKAGGIRHLEAGCLALASLAGRSCHGLDGWLTAMRGEPQTDAKPTTCPPWYAAADGQPAPTLPRTLTGEELAIAIAMLKRVSEQAAITCVDLGAEVIFEDRFNQMVAATRSKAAMSFTFVARHLQTIWQRFGKHHPFVAVDRQSGRTHYRQPLALSFPDVHLRILEEADHRSAYRLEQGDCRMTIVFQVDGESSHLPTAVASMTAKYTRELLMECFNAYFTRHVPAVKATAGYGTDGKRFWNDIQPHLAKLGIDGTQLRRCT